MSRNLQVKVILYYGATLKNAATKCLGFHNPRGKAYKSVNHKKELAYKVQTY